MGRFFFVLVLVMSVCGVATLALAQKTDPGAPPAKVDPGLVCLERLSTTLQSSKLPDGAENSLLAKVDAAQALYDKGKTGTDLAAGYVLEAALHEVQALSKGPLDAASLEPIGVQLEQCALVLWYKHKKKCGYGVCVGESYCDFCVCHAPWAPQSDICHPCHPIAGKPACTLEGDLFQAQVKCGTGFPMPKPKFSVTGLPPGATYSTTTGVISWTPSLSQAGPWNIGLSVPGPLGETGILHVPVLDKFADPGNIQVVDPSAYAEECGLPVLFLYPEPTSDAAYIPVTVIYGGHTYAGAQAKLRGAASLAYPKKSFLVKFSTGDLFQEPTRAGGFTNRRRIVLTSTFDDNSYMRQRMSYELWNDMDPGHLPIQAYSGVVFTGPNTTATGLAYKGLYTIGDHIDREFLDERGVWPGTCSNSSGNQLFKAVDHDANFSQYFAFSTTPKPAVCTGTAAGIGGGWAQGYEKKEGTPLSDFSALCSLVQTVATTTDAVFQAQIGTQIVQSEFEDWWIFATFIAAHDSAGKNAYLYRQFCTAGEKWRFLPWDFNDSFGQNWQTTRAPATQYLDFYTLNRLFERLGTIPAIAGPLYARYDAVLHAQFDLAGLLARVDAYDQELYRSALRDEQKWGAQYVSWFTPARSADFNTYSGEVAYVKQWIADRWANQDGLY